ncbi:exosome complex component RRP46-like [Oppia nitens]|uniref:exosome complex component RRP46-like n=1 Tax=Oppia nitens TaxID=1686743 RepID=UPI0023DACFC5|nr:exosome complex component RRP46-like [Oppia nitens]
MSSRDRIQSVVLSNLNRSDGSSLYSFGDTVVQTSVFGPTEVHQNKEDPTGCALDVHYRRLIRNINRDDPQTKAIERFLHSNLLSILYARLYPRTLLTVTLQELQSGGSFMSTCLNGSVLALLDSGFPLKYLLAAVEAIITESGQLIVNPSDEESQSAAAVGCVVFESIQNSVISVVTTGDMTFNQMQQMISSCSKSAKNVFAFYRNSIEKRFK